MRRLMTTTEAGRYLGCSRSTVIRLTDQGLLATVPGFTERRYAVGELDRFAAQTPATGEQAKVLATFVEAFRRVMAEGAAS